MASSSQPDCKLNAMMCAWPVCAAATERVSEGDEASEAAEAAAAKDQFLGRKSKEFITVEIIKKEQTDVIGIE